jgi:hypothetical protein
MSPNTSPERNHGDSDPLTEPAEQIFVRSRSVVSRVVAGETLIVPVRGTVGDLASIYSFNGTGSLIWQLLDSPRGLTDLIDAVEREYDVPQEQAQKDVTQFLNDMLSVGLVEICQVEIDKSGAMPEISMTATEPNRQQVLETAGLH